MSGEGKISLVKSYIYKDSVLIALNSSQVRPTTTVFDTGAGLNLVQDDVSDHFGLNSDHQRNISEFRRASSKNLTGSETINLHLRIRDLYVRVTFDIAEKFTAPVLLETNFIDKFIRPIHPTETKTVPHDSLPVPAMIVHGPEV